MYTLRHKYNTAQLQLTANRSTRLIPLPTAQTQSGGLVHYHPRQCTAISDLSAASQLPYRELDTVGVVVHVRISHLTSHDPESPAQVVETVFLTDAKEGVLVLKVWGGLQVRLVLLAATKFSVLST